MCKSCHKHFSVDYHPSKISDKDILVRHLEGTPIRKLANQLGRSKSPVGRTILNTLRRVPNSNHISELVCKYFCGVFIVDGKYVKVKGHDRKIPMIWGLDYLSHDVLVHQLVGSENYQAYLSLFRKLKAIKYPLEFLVCDDLDSIVYAAKFVYPKVKIQLCTNHYKENVRRLLKSRSHPEHEDFINELEYIFKAQNLKHFNARARYVVKHYQHNIQYMQIMADLDRNSPLITTYLKNNRCPSTTNLIELYNSHLEARLHSLKGFQSFHTAELWLNAYVMNRRLTKFTDCSKKFKNLNGKCSLAFTASYDAPKVSLLKRV